MRMSPMLVRNVACLVGMISSDVGWATVYRPAACASIPPIVAVTVTPQAVEVLRRALDAARLDPATTGVRIGEARGLRGTEVRTGFAEQPEDTEDVVEAGGIRLFVSRALSERDAVVDV